MSCLSCGGGHTAWRLVSLVPGEHTAVRVPEKRICSSAHHRPPVASVKPQNAPLRAPIPAAAAVAKGGLGDAAAGIPVAAECALRG